MRKKSVSGIWIEAPASHTHHTKTEEEKKGGIEEEEQKTKQNKNTCGSRPSRAPRCIPKQRA